MAELYLHLNLALSRCPHCQVARPTLSQLTKAPTQNHAGRDKRIWGFYRCTNCGGVVTAWSTEGNQRVVDHFPKQAEVAEDIPERARGYLRQAIEAMHAPALAVMGAASSVDAMLKEKGYQDGTLNQRIDKAVKDHLLTEDMGQWAHKVRLDANAQRHADEAAPMPTQGDAQRTIEFARALAQFLFVLPARVKQGIENAQSGSESK